MSKIINCNQNLVDQIINSGKMPERYLADDYEQKYKKYKENFPIDGKFFYDRSGTIPHYLNVDAARNPIPSATNFNLSFSEVVETRAKQLLDLGKPISN